MSMAIKVQMKGFDKLQRWIELAPEKMQLANQRAGEKLAKEAAKHARDLIKSQMFMGAAVPLSPAYAWRKAGGNRVARQKRRTDRGLGLDAPPDNTGHNGRFEIFINKGILLSLIKPHPYVTVGFDSSWGIGILPNTWDDGKDYGEICNVLETGTQDGILPPRPLWGQVEYHIQTMFYSVVLDEYRRVGLLKK